MLKPITPRDIAERYHRFLPEEIRSYLKGRGIADEVINRQLLGWNGKRITIPIFGRDGHEVLSFRYAKSPKDKSGSPKMLTQVGATVELYGQETLMRELYRVVVCEGEFDRLVLESHGVPAVTSTAGVNTFLAEWAPLFGKVKRVFICFDRDPAGETAAKNVKAILPQAKLVRLPADVGDKGDIGDFFGRLGRTRVDFDLLLAAAAAAEDEPEAAVNPADPDGQRPAPGRPKSVSRRAERLKNAIPLAAIVRRYTTLQPSGQHFLSRCPFHEDRSPSFTVYRETQTYYCFGCGAHGDVVKFLMDKESMTFGQALEALERFETSNELF
jgi:DNA primase